MFNLLILLSSFFVKAEVVWTPMPEMAYKLGDHYPEAQNLLYAFDYGHALVYEQLLNNRGNISDPEVFEKDLLKQVQAILKSPPKVKIDETDIAPSYTYTFPLTLNLFDWSHMLHQFVLDILATRDSSNSYIKEINNLYKKYSSKPEIAITDVCKTMLFMDGHYFSKSFRKEYPSFNLLIWSYHWFQIKLYEDLLLPTKMQRDAAVNGTVNEFFNLISNLPESADFDMMPETAKVAPTLAKLFPKLPPAFDNNHMLHDIVSDILVSKKIDTKKIRAEGLKTARMALDPEAFKSELCTNLEKTK